MERHCAASGEPFEVSEADLAFYEKISPVFGGKKHLIPPPMLCPDCRQQRRLAFRNERKLYKRKSDLSEKELISIYSPEKPYTIYDQEEWWSDSWDPLSYGQEFDFSRTFFSQFEVLSRAVPRVALVNNQAENSPYCNFADWNKECHLLINSNTNEHSFYSTLALENKSVMDALWVVKSELSYECVNVEKSYNLRFSRECSQCTDSAFLNECRGCQNCIGCMNLRNKKLHVFNRPVSAAEFAAIMASFSDFTKLQEFRKEFENFVRTEPHPAFHLLSSEDCRGDHLSQCAHMTECFDGFESEDCRYSYDFLYCKNCVDGNSVQSGEACYEVTSFLGFQSHFAAFCRECSDSLYCWDCHFCQDCFGCVGLRRKQYCALNTQYTKEAYEALVPQIIAHMEKSGEWGEFFPVEISPFAYNETVAAEYFPLTRKEIAARRWQWKEELEPDLSGVTKKIPAEKLPDDIGEIPDDILNWALICSESKKLFMLQKAELEFYRKMRLPIPRLHPDVRHEHRMALRNPRKLWKRECANCHKEIETTYAPNRPEIVYCEECYLKTVY